MVEWLHLLYHKHLCLLVYFVHYISYRNKAQGYKRPQPSLYHSKAYLNPIISSISH